MKSNSPKREASMIIIKTNAQIRSFENISFHPGVETINLSNNIVFDFEGFHCFEKLKTLILDDNPILSFKDYPIDDGLNTNSQSGTPNLEEISLINCPISKIENFRSLCLIVMGSQLKKINGIDVTRNDQNIASKYGDSQTIRLLLIAGWIPERSVTLKKSTVDSIFQFINSRKDDPFSLKAVSLLRTIGYSKSEIKNFIRLYFSPNISYDSQKIKKKNSILSKDQQIDPIEELTPGSIEDQIQKQQKIINVLSVQLQALRNGNKSFNAYDELIKTFGAPLIENAKIVGEMTAKMNNKDSDLELNQSKSTSKVNEAEDYEELRKAAIELISEDETIDDYELINKLTEYFQDDEESQNEELNE